MIYRFDNFELDIDRFELRSGGVPRKVEPQVFALLELIVANHARLVTKDEINLHVWGGRVVSEAVVNSRVRMARQVIGDDGNAIAARMFDRAVTADQGFARAHAGLSFTHFQNAFPGHAGDHGEQRSLARLYA